MQDWLVLQLADATFPSGGFAHSGGLEATMQAGGLAAPAALERFIHDAVWQAGHMTLPFVAAAHGDEPLRQAELGDGLLVQRAARDEGDRRGTGGTAERPEHRPHHERLRGRDGGVRIAHLRPHDQAALDHELGARAEEGGAPEHDVRELADLERADLVREAVGDGRVDRDLGDVAADAGVVVVALLSREAAALLDRKSVV